MGVVCVCVHVPICEKTFRCVYYEQIEINISLRVGRLLSFSPRNKLPDISTPRSPHCFIVIYTIRVISAHQTLQYL